jgi:hypothetical protein
MVLRVSIMPMYRPRLLWGGGHSPATVVSLTLALTAWRTTVGLTSISAVLVASMALVLAVAASSAVTTAASSLTTDIMLRTAAMGGV